MVVVGIAKCDTPSHTQHQWALFEDKSVCVCVGVAEEGQKCSVEGDDGSVLLQVKEKRDNFAESK